MPSGAGNCGASSEPSRSLHLVDGVRSPGIADLGRISAQIEETERHAGHARIHQVIDRAGRLIVGFRGIEDEAVLAVPSLLPGQREADLERTVAMTVGVDGIREAVRSVVEGLCKPGAHQAARAGQQLRKRVGDHVRSEAIEDLADAFDAQLDARHQRAHVAVALIGETRVAVEDGESGLVHLPCIDHPGGGMMMPS